MKCKKCDQEPDNKKLNLDGICWDCWKESQVEEKPKKQISLEYEDVFEEEIGSEIKEDLEDVKQSMLNNVKQNMLNNKNKYLGLRVTSDLYKKLENMAYYEGVTLSESVRRILQSGANAFDDYQEGESK